MSSFQKRSIGPYRYLKTLRYGSFSEVVLVARKSDLFACKILNRNSIIGIEDALENEIIIHRMLHHSHIAELIDLFADESKFYLISEYCPKGDLCDQLSQNGRFSEQIVKKMAKQIISALNYLHQNKISHRDIKPDNLLIDSLCNIKLADFGLSSFFSENGTVFKSCGSIQYASPECVNSNEYNGKTTDVWSLGITLYLLLTGSLPWKGRDEASITQEILTAEIRPPRFVSPMCCDFIMRMLDKNWSTRLTLDEALNHPWFNGEPKPEMRSRSSIPTAHLLPIVNDKSTPDTATESHARFKPSNNTVKSDASFGKLKPLCDSHVAKEVENSPLVTPNSYSSRSLITEDKMQAFLSELNKLRDSHQCQINRENASMNPALANDSALEITKPSFDIQPQDSSSVFQLMSSIQLIE